MHANDLADLELTPAAMQNMGDFVLRHVVDHLASIAEQPVSGDLDTAEQCRALRESAPETGAALEPLVERLFSECIPRTHNTASPGFLAYVPSGGVFPSALADLIASATNRYTGVWQAAPALVQLEANALDWLRDWMQFPATTRGVFTTGGSAANFGGIVCARERHPWRGHPSRHDVRVVAGASLRHEVRPTGRRDGGSGPRHRHRLGVPHARR